MLRQVPLNNWTRHQNQPKNRELQLKKIRLLFPNLRGWYLKNFEIA